MSDEYAEDRQKRLNVVLGDYEALAKTLQSNFKRDVAEFNDQRVRLIKGKYKGYYATIKRFSYTMWSTSVELDIMRKDGRGTLQDWNSRFVDPSWIEFF